MKKLTSLIIKYPVKILLVTLVILIVLAIGITKIKLKTGNDTLISANSDIYKNNEAYQNEFGKDPIILIFDEDERFEPATLKFMNKLQGDIENLEGIFAINSPVTVMKQIGKKMYTETEAGLTTMAEGLSTISNQLRMLGEQLVSTSSSDLPDLDGLASNMQQLISAQNQLEMSLVNTFDAINMMENMVAGLDNDLNILKSQIEGDPLLVDELEQINTVIDNVNILNISLSQITSQDGIKIIPIQTVQVLSNILITLSTLSTKLNNQIEAMQTLSNALIGIGNNLSNLSVNLSQIQNNFNTFKPGFPTSDETIHFMTYEDNELRDNFKGFVVSETQIRMVIILNGDVTGEQIDIISDTLNNRLLLEEKEDEVLISGKPILDRSIKSSMMDSMKFMMLSAILIMILILVLIYKVRMRILPIIMVLMAVVGTIGIMGWLSIGLTMVSMAVFPVLIGLGIDYFIQFQTRYEEERGRL